MSYEQVAFFLAGLIVGFLAAIAAAYHIGKRVTEEREKLDGKIPRN